MSVFYSDHFSTDNSTLDAQVRVSAGVGHGRLRYKRAEVTADINSTADIVRMAQFKSGDRIAAIRLSSTDAGNAGDLNVGLHKSGLSHDGAVIDADLFGAAIDVNAAALDRAEAFTEASLTGVDRGKTLWALAGQSSNPMEDWDLTIMASEITQNATTIVLEIEYTSGD